MKTKQKRMALISVILSVILLSGCSSAEIGMTSNLIRQAAMSDSRTTGSLTIVPNWAEIEPLLSQMEEMEKKLRDYFENGGVEVWEREEGGPSILRCLAGHTYRLDYEIRQKRGENGIYSSIVISGSVDGGASTPLGIIALTEQGEVLYSTDFLRGCYDLIAAPVREDGCTDILFSEAFEKAWKDSLEGCDYVLARGSGGYDEEDWDGCENLDEDWDEDEDEDWDSGEEDYDPASMVDGILRSFESEEAVKELTRLVSQFGEDVLPGDATGLVRSTGGGQEFSVTLRQLLDAVFAAADAALKDGDRFNEAAFRFIDGYERMMLRGGFWTQRDAEEFDQVMNWFLNGMSYSLGGFLNKTDSWRQSGRYLQGLVNAMIMFMEDSRISYRIQPRDGGFDTRTEIVVNWKGADLLTVTGQAQRRPDGESLVPVESQSPMSDLAFAEALQQALNRVNPAVRASLDWYSLDIYDLDESEKGLLRVWISYERAGEENGWQDDYGTCYGYLLDGRLYLPLREVAGQFGEEVGYDAKTRSAYIMRDDVRTNLSGINRDGTFYVMIRDFEKLGYTVEFAKDSYGDPVVHIIRAGE